MRHVSVAELKANAAELTAAMQAGEQVVITLEGREYRLVAEEPVLSLERRQVMEDTAAIRQSLRDRGVSVTREEVRAWIDEGRP